VPLGNLLQSAELMPNAKYIVFRCADDLEQSRDGSGLYYESIDLVDAFHPQTIMAYAMNGQALPVPHGAPLRLRVERQLGYKMAKYVMRIEASKTSPKSASAKADIGKTAAMNGTPASIRRLSNCPKAPHRTHSFVRLSSGRSLLPL